MTKIKNISISNFINSDLKNYAIYTLEHRGIPDFYDALTNVQRLILLNTPKNLTKTISVVGSCISDGYHHGDASLQKATSRLARPYGNSISMLKGDGFFGNSINTESAAARYTSVGLNSEISEIIDKYKVLNLRDDNDNYLPFHLEIPIGLVNTIIGIAVGYKTTILPRSIKDISSYLKGKKKTCPPSFQGFNGKISQFQELRNAWLFEGEISLTSQSIEIQSLPPLMSYKSFIVKLDKILDDLDVKIENNTSDKINLKIIFKTANDFEQVKEKIIKLTQQIVKENIVFIKDNKILEYDSVENYLDDFKNYLITLNIKYCNYKINWFTNEIEFLEAKHAYLSYMVANSSNISQIDVDNEIKRYKQNIRERLERILLRNLNKTELIKTSELRRQYLSELQVENDQLVYLNKTKAETDFTLHTKKLNNLDLEHTEYNDIEIFKITEEDNDGDTD